MDARILAEFGMEGCCHDSSLPHGDWIVTLGGDDFYPGADAFDFRGADKNHFDGFFTEPAFADGAVDLAAVGVAANSDVDRTESRLLRVFHFVG